MYTLVQVFHQKSLSTQQVGKDEKTLISCVGRHSHTYADRSTIGTTSMKGNATKYITHIHIWVILRYIYIDIYLYTFGYIHIHYSCNIFWLIPLQGIYHTNVFTNIKWHFYKIIHCSCVSKARNWKPLKWQERTVE